jgi:hypothetical protein
VSDPKERRSQPRQPSTAKIRWCSVDDILGELGSYVGPEVAEWKPPVSLLGRVLGRLFKPFR